MARLHIGGDLVAVPLADAFDDVLIDADRRRSKIPEARRAIVGSDHAAILPSIVRAAPISFGLPSIAN
jgi:hypothetical protein